MLGQVLREAVEAGTVPHAVAITPDGEFTAGDVTPDSLFWLASMTKPVTTLGALRLEDLDLDAPVAHYVPDFARLQVLDGGTLRPPKVEATVQHLLTHTSGLGYYFLNADLLRWRREHGTGREKIYAEPLIADPGTRFSYGISTDWLGRVVEAISGRPLDEYLRDVVLEPLGMDDTTFHPTPEQRARLVPVHVRNDGMWQAVAADGTDDPNWHPGGHGLYSTPRDFARFAHALLDEPDLFVAQVDFPAHQPTAHPRVAADLRFGPGFSWSKAMLVRENQGGWMGLYNTFFWVDRTAGTTAALYTQTQPFADPAILELAKRVGAFYA
jgi:CubicO group peptidase (beta-lactamase class C family)